MKTITRRVFALFIAVTLCAGVLIFSASADGDAFRIKETEATFSNFAENCISVYRIANIHKK